MNFVLQDGKKQTVPHESTAQISLHLNGHTLGFYPQTKKLSPHLLTQGLTLGVKGLITIKLFKSIRSWLKGFPECI